MGLSIEHFIQSYGLKENDVSRYKHRNGYHGDTIFGVRYIWCYQRLQGVSLDPPYRCRFVSQKGKKVTICYGGIEYDASEIMCSDEYSNNPKSYKPLGYYRSYDQQKPKVIEPPKPAVITKKAYTGWLGKNNKRSAPTYPGYYGGHHGDLYD